MNKAKPIAGLVILALLGSGAWYLLHDRTTETREPTAWGHVDTRSVSLAFEIGGRIAELGPEEGMRVKAGDVLGRLDTRSLELERARLIASAEALKAQYSLAEEGARQEDIAVARAELAALRQSLRLARITADRQEELYRAKATTEQLRDEARFTLAQRTAQEKSLAEQLRKLENGSRPQEIAAARAQWEAAKAAVAQLDHQINVQSVLRSPADGFVRVRAAHDLRTLARRPEVGARLSHRSAPGRSARRRRRDGRNRHDRAHFGAHRLHQRHGRIHAQDRADRRSAHGARL